MGTSIIENLGVALGARTKQFTRRMKRASRSVRMFGADVAASARRIAAPSAALAAFAGGGGMGFLIKRSMETTDAVSKLSDKLQVSTADLVGLQHAADLTGTKQETLTEGLQVFTRQLGQAAAGIGTGAQAYAALGLSAEELAKQSPADAFATIAERIRQIESPTERAAAAFSIFSEKGMQMMNLLLLGSGGIEAAREEAEKLGLTFSREMGVKIETANDNMDRVAKVFQGVARTAAIELAPMISKVATQFIELATRGGGMGPKVSRAVEWIVRSVAKLADWLELVKMGWHSFRGVASMAVVALLAPLDVLQRGLQKLLDVLGVEVDVTSEDFTNLVEGFAQTAEQAFSEAGAAYDRFVSDENERRVTEFFATMRREADAAAEATVESLHRVSDAEAEGFMQAFRAREEAAKAQAQIQREMESAANSLRQRVQTPLEKFREQMAELEKLQAGGFLDETTVQRAADLFRKELQSAIGPETLGRFATIRLGEVALGGTAGGRKRRQPVEDPQLAETNELLRTQNRLLAGQTAMTVA